MNGVDSDEDDIYPPLDSSSSVDERLTPISSSGSSSPSYGGGSGRPADVRGQRLIRPADDESHQPSRFLPVVPEQHSPRSVQGPAEKEQPKQVTWNHGGYHLTLASSLSQRGVQVEKKEETKEETKEEPDSIGIVDVDESSSSSTGDHEPEVLDPPSLNDMRHMACGTGPMRVEISISPPSDSASSSYPSERTEDSSSLTQERLTQEPTSLGDLRGDDVPANSEEYDDDSVREEKKREPESDRTSVFDPISSSLIRTRDEPASESERKNAVDLIEEERTARAGEVKRLEDLVMQLQNEKDAAINQIFARVSKMQEEMENKLKEQRELLEKKQEEIEERVKQLEEANANAAEIVKKLQAELSEKEQQMASLKGEVESTKNELETAKRKVAETEAKANAREEEEEARKEKIDELEGKLKEQSETIKLLESRLATNEEKPATGLCKGRQRSFSPVRTRSPVAMKSTQPTDDIASEIRDMYRKNNFKASDDPCVFEDRHFEYLMGMTKKEYNALGQVKKILLAKEFWNKFFNLF